jgi:hypothetical protein
MSLPKAHARATRSTQLLRVVPRPIDPKDEPTLPISVETLRAMANEREKAARPKSVPPPLPAAARKQAAPSGSMPPITTTVVTRRPAGGSLVVSLWAAWLGAAGLFLGTAAIVLRIETRTPAAQASAAAPGVVQSSAPAAVELPRVVLPRADGTPSPERTPAPAQVTVKAPATAHAAAASKSKPTSMAVPSSKSLSVAPGGRGSEIVRTLDWGPSGNAAPAPSKPAAAPAETAQAVMGSADAELQAVVRAMH